jgi:ribosomal protein L37AE/L43A
MTFDPTPGQTMAQQNSRELRSSGNGWAPVHANPIFVQPEPIPFANDAALTCQNCGSAATRRTGPQERQCIKCRATWQTSALTQEEKTIEAHRQKEAAKK